MRVETLMRLRAAILAQAELCVEIIDNALGQQVAAEPTKKGCPHCGEMKNLEDSTAMGEPRRVTCLACGDSYHPAPEKEV